MIDKQIRDLIQKEEERQNSVVSLIPSENFASDEVRMALGSCFDSISYHSDHAGS
jgi:glycine/serine hydroxymethyltransferase